MTILPLYSTAFLGQSKLVFNHRYDGYFYNIPVARLYRSGYRWPYNLKERVRCTRENQ